MITEFDIAVGTFNARELQQACDFASIAFRAGIPSLTGMVGRAETTIGPLAIPHRTACWNCGRLRLQANAKCSNAAEEFTEVDGLVDGISQHLADAVCDALCLGPDGSSLINHVLLFDAVSMRTS